jgi:hypothetical protein
VSGDGQLVCTVDGVATPLCAGVAEELIAEEDASHTLVDEHSEAATADEHGEEGHAEGHGDGHGDEHGEHGDGNGDEHGDHGEHAHHHPPLIFASSDDFDVQSIAYTMVGLILFTLAFEKIVDYIKERAHPYPHYEEMFKKILTELTILGFISFLLTIFIQSGLLPHCAVLTSFEFSHVLIFFVGVILVIQGINTALSTASIKREWSAAANEDTDAIIENYQRKMAWWNPFFYFSPEYEMLQYYVLKRLFVLGQKADPNSRIMKEIEDFDFGMYLEINLNMLVVDFVEIEEGTWVMTMLVGGLITLCYHFGDVVTVHFVEHGGMGGDGLAVFWRLGWAGGVFMVILLIMAQRTMHHFLRLVGIKNTKYQKMLDAFKHLEHTPDVTLAHVGVTAIEPKEFLRCFPLGSYRFFHLSIDMINMFNCIYLG